jgi:hypothetical protein
MSLWSQVPEYPFVKQPFKSSIGNARNGFPADHSTLGVLPLMGRFILGLDPYHRLLRCRRCQRDGPFPESSTGDWNLSHKTTVAVGLDLNGRGFRFDGASFPVDGFDAYPTMAFQGP